MIKTRSIVGSRFLKRRKTIKLSVLFRRPVGKPHDEGRGINLLGKYFFPLVAGAGENDFGQIVGVVEDLGVEKNVRVVDG